MPRITISYRRNDSVVIPGRIFDRLAAHYGRESVFRDIDNIPPGADFRKHIDQVLDDSDIVLAIVGPKWIGPRANQSRLTNAADPVRVEIETALRKDRPLIPVLVQRASMPRVEQLPQSMQDFAYRNAVDIDAGRDFDHHMMGLIRAMDRMLEDGPAAEASAAEDAEEALGSGELNGRATREQDLSREEPPRASAEIESLREANRALEAQVVAITGARDERAQQAATLSEEIAGVLRERETTAAQRRETDEITAKLEQRDAQIESLSNELAVARVARRPGSLAFYRAALVVLTIALGGATIMLGVGNFRPGLELAAADRAKLQDRVKALEGETAATAEKARLAQKALDDKALASEKDSRQASAQINELNRQLADLRQKPDSTGMQPRQASLDSIGAGTLGFTVRDLTREETRTASGVKVVKVDPASPANTNVSSGDIIIALDGQPVKSAAEWTENIAKSPIGKSVHLLLKDGQSTKGLYL